MENDSDACCHAEEVAQITCKKRWVDSNASWDEGLSYHVCLDYDEEYREHEEGGEGTKGQFVVPGNVLSSI